MFVQFYINSLLVLQCSVHTAESTYAVYKLYTSSDVKLNAHQWR